MVALHRAIADWLEPRRESILGAMPLDIPPYDWGYAVRQPKTGDVYLHILSNPRGKRGMFERRYVDLQPFARTVTSVTRFPDGAPVPYDQHKDRLSIDMQGVAHDPVDTILRVTVE